MLPTTRVRALAGVVGPLFFAGAVAALTVAEHGFLHRIGWSAVHRTEVEWPSLLALGRYGWVMVATFVVNGICGLALSSAMWSESLRATERVEAVFVAVMSVAIGLEAFRPDSPRRTGVASWHDAVHNGAFPVILIASLAAAAIAVYSSRRSPQPYITYAWSAVLLSLMVVGIALTSVESIAQLARYLYFGALLAWIELVALGTLARSRKASPSPQPSTPRRS